MKIISAGARQAVAASLLAVLSALPYAMIYLIDRGLGVPHAARSALWPTAVVPVLVATVFAVHLVRARISPQARFAAVQALAQRPALERVG